MQHETDFQQKLLDLTRRVVKLAHQRGRLPGDSADFVQEAETISSLIAQQVTEQILQTAVVGAIKSGKSTFINALLGQDYLKRGAGVITSMVTRVRRGQALRACLQFKAWSEINQEINRARLLLPEDDAPAVAELDLRNHAHRARLQQALARLAPESWVQEGRLNSGALLLSAYLSGYDRAHPLVQSDRAEQEFSDADFGTHQDFVSNDALAIYLKDIQLRVDAPALPQGVEIADCQGSDAPNPLHLAMIQEYLLQTHLLVYVISSRTGLRQADIRFLSMIHTMGILPQTLFVVNCDLNEHASLEDLQDLTHRIQTDLKVIQPDPDIYVFSALYVLFQQTVDNLEDRDLQRLRQWQGDTATVHFCDTQYAGFQQALTRKLTQERIGLLVANHSERLAVLLARLNRANYLHADLLGRDRLEMQTLIDQVGIEQHKLMHLHQLVQDSLAGALVPLKQKLRKAVDSFFDTRYGALGTTVREFIRHYQLPTDLALQHNPAEGFSAALYTVYQDFKQSLDRFMTETVNPEIVRFVREREQSVQDHLRALSTSYQIMLQEALQTYHHNLEAAGLPPTAADREPSIQAPPMARIRERAGLNIPSMQATLEYSAQVKAQSFLRLGFYNVLRLVRSVLKKHRSSPAAEQRRALQDGLQQMQRVLEKAISMHLKDYRENIKFQYLFKLTDQAAALLLEDTQACLNIYKANLAGLSDMVENQTLDKQQFIQALSALSRQADNLLAEIKQLHP